MIELVHMFASGLMVLFSRDLINVRKTGAF